MADKIDPIPEDMTIDEASEFWSTHSIADYSSHLVEMEYRAGERLSFIAIANDLLAQVDKQAKEQGISAETLVNLWVQEKLTA